MTPDSLAWLGVTAAGAVVVAFFTWLVRYIMKERELALAALREKEVERIVDAKLSKIFKSLESIRVRVDGICVDLRRLALHKSLDNPE